jgi:hypothetical protein
MHGIVEISVATTAIAAGITASLFIARCLYRIARWLHRIARLIEAIHYEVKPNAGNSMRDAVGRIDARLAKHHDALIAAGLLTDETHQGTDAHTTHN